MSKGIACAIFAWLIVLEQATLLSAAYYTDFVETTYDDANWVLVTCDLLLRANTCIASDERDWYEKVFKPCYSQSRYWKLAEGAGRGGELGGICRRYRGAYRGAEGGA